VLNLSNPEYYIAELAVLLAGYPEWAGEAALNWIKDVLKYPTTRAELKPLLEDQVRYVKPSASEEPSQFVGRTFQGRPVDELTWMGVPLTARQKQQLLDRESYDNSVRSDPTRPTYQELQAKYGKAFGVTDAKTETAEQTNARWAGQTKSWEEIGQFYRDNPERWRELVREREAGLK